MSTRCRVALVLELGLGEALVLELRDLVHVDWKSTGTPLPPPGMHCHPLESSSGIHWLELHCHPLESTANPPAVSSVSYLPGVFPPGRKLIWLPSRLAMAFPPCLPSRPARKRGRCTKSQESLGTISEARNHEDGARTLVTEALVLVLRLLAKAPLGLW